MKNKIFTIMLEIFAVLAPFYMVFYHGLYENYDKPMAKALRTCTWSGFGAYALLAIVLITKG